MGNLEWPGIVTDNAGRVAFCEPGLMDREIFFSVRSHGYGMKKDGFGYAGERFSANWKGCGDKNRPAKRG